MATVIERTYEISASHQLEGHPKCGRIHGHNYVITVSVMADIHPTLGWIMDFGDLDKLVVKPVIDQMDHMYLLSGENIDTMNPIALAAASLGQAYTLTARRSTAEMMSEMLAKRFFVDLSKFVEVTNVSVTIQETSRSSATSTCFYVDMDPGQELAVKVEGGGGGG